MTTKKKFSQIKTQSKDSSSSKLVKKQSMRDLLATPTSEQIQASIQKGVTRTLADFRRIAKL